MQQQPSRQENKPEEIPTKPKLSAHEVFKIQMMRKSVSEDQQTRISLITEKFEALGAEIIKLTRPSADQTACLRKLREAKWTITDAIACEEYLT